MRSCRCAALHPDLCSAAPPAPLTEDECAQHCTIAGEPRGGHEEKQEVAVVTHAHAVVDPAAVVVMPGHAAVAHPAVLAAGGPCPLARGALLLRPARDGRGAVQVGQLHMIG
jgi:hypothetical protein